MGRIKSYVGPGKTIKPEDISNYGRDWIAEEKHDGFWAVGRTDNEGVLYSLESRTGQSFERGHVGKLIGLKTHLPNCELVGELEAGTKSANKKYSEIKHRRFIIFDAIKLLGQSITHLELENRRSLLETALVRNDIGNLNEILPLVIQRKEGFLDLYKEVMLRGGEGIVIKRKNSKYNSHRSSGKVDYWVRCKEKNTVDYFIMGVGKTQGGSDNLDCGLWNGNKIVHALHVPLPKGYKAINLVGKIIECEGWEISAGILRSAHFKRIRTDKTMDMCV